MSVSFADRVQMAIDPFDLEELVMILHSNSQGSDDAFAKAANALELLKELLEDEPSE